MAGEGFDEGRGDVEDLGVPVADINRTHLFLVEADADQIGGQHG